MTGSMTGAAARAGRREGRPERGQRVRAAGAAALWLAAALVLAGCNTVAGIGQDVTDSAHAVQGMF